MSRLDKLIPDRKSALIATSGAIGLVTAALSVGINNLLMTAVGLFIAFIPFLIVERLETKEIRKSFKDELVATNKRLDRIDGYLKASSADELEVAIFDHLLIYLPMYVAKERGYFREEGINIKFIPKLGDIPVAEAVWSSKVDIGLCDPCMCAREEFCGDGNRLLVLAPMVTKSAVKPVTKHSLRVDTSLRRGGKITIATYPAPSTTYVMAANLKKKLQEINKAKNAPPLMVDIVVIPPERFSEENLMTLLEEFDLLMLWDPLLKAALIGAETVIFNLGEDYKDPNELIYSALVISERLLERKPTLGIRIFRALSRASYEIHLAVKMSEESPDLLDSVIRAACAEKSATLPKDILRALIKEMVSNRLFPLITEPRQLHADPKWREQLYNALRHRGHAIASDTEKFEESSVPITNADECRRFFCPVEALSVANPTIFDKN